MHRRSTAGGVIAEFPSDRHAKATAAERLAGDLKLQRAIEHLHRLGPRPTGAFIAELIDKLGADPAKLDLLLDWLHLDPAVYARLGVDQFPRPPLDLVPL